MLRAKSVMTTKRRKTMRTKSKTQTRKAHPLAKRVTFGLIDKEAFVKADHEKGEDEKIILVHVSGSISTKAAIRRLLLIISYLERKGLPVEPTSKWAPMNFLSRSGSDHRR